MFIIILNLTSLPTNQHSGHEIAKVLDLTKESGYTKAELETYDKYWNCIRIEKTLN